MAAWEMSKEEHYKQTLETIIAIGCDYDGYSTKAGYKGLIDDLVDLASKSLKLEPILITGNNEPAYTIKP